MRQVYDCEVFTADNKRVIAERGVINKMGAYLWTNDEEHFVTFVPMRNILRVEYKECKND